MNVRNKHLLLHNWGDIEQIIKENGLSGDFDLKMVKLSANSKLTSWTRFPLSIKECLI